MRRAAPFLPLPGLAVLTDCARSIWSPIPISIPAKGHIGGRSELNGGLRVITSVAAIDPHRTRAGIAGVPWGATHQWPRCRTTSNFSQRTTSGKSGKCARGRGPQTKDSTSFKAAFMLAPMDPPPPENPLFPLRLDTSVGGGGTDERLHHDQLNTRSVACKNSQPSLRLWGR